MDTDKKTVLLVVELQTAFRELIRIADLLKETHSYHPILYFYNCDRSLSNMQKICEARGIPYLTFVNPRNSPRFFDENGDYPLINHRNSPARIRRILIKFLPIWLRNVFTAVGLIRIQLRSFYDGKRILKLTKPKLVIVPEDGIGGNLMLIKTARERKIPVVIVPYEYSTKKQIVEAIIHQNDYQRIYGMNDIWNRIAAKWFPNWSYIYDSEKLLRTNGLSVMAYQLLGIAPRDPWTVHGGYSDKIAVESEAMLGHYLQESIPKEKLVRVGSVANDQMQNILRNEELKSSIFHSMSLSTKHMAIVSAIPTDYTSRPESEFKNYTDLIDFWISTLAALQDVNVIIQLHPEVTAEQESYILSKHVMVSKENIATLIAVSDILVTSVSSIIRYAISCGKPVINYDVYRFEYPDYINEKGVLTVRTRDEFAMYIHKLSNNSQYFNEISNQQAQSAMKWGELDGKSGERLLNLFNQLVGLKEVD